MIFVTVGTEFPFDRLIRAMDDWAADNPQDPVIAQIGTGAYEPRHMTWHRRMGRAAFAELVTAAELIVAHAGIGSLVTAGEYGKPVVLLPRRARFGEQRNDHQLDTAARLGGVRGSASPRPRPSSAPASPRRGPEGVSRPWARPRPRRSSPACGISSRARMNRRR